jgi:hypothetical protein
MIQLTGPVDTQPTRGRRTLKPSHNLKQFCVPTNVQKLILKPDCLPPAE